MHPYATRSAVVDAGWPTRPHSPCNGTGIAGPVCDPPTESLRCSGCNGSGVVTVTRADAIVILAFPEERNRARAMMLPDADELLNRLAPANRLGIDVTLLHDVVRPAANALAWVYGADGDEEWDERWGYTLAMAETSPETFRRRFGDVQGRGDAQATRAAGGGAGTGGAARWVGVSAGGPRDAPGGRQGGP